MSKRNVKKLFGNFSSNLVKKLWAKINTGSYGSVSLPDDSQTLSIKSDTDAMVEYEDEKSGAVTNARASFTPVRMKGKTKVSLSTHLHTSGDTAVESSLGAFLETLMGKKETIATTRGATIIIEDPLAVKAGFTLTTAGALIGIAGNYVTLTIVNAGSSGSASVAASGSDYTLTVYNNSTVQDVITALHAKADLNCVADANGDDITDLMIDLMASRGIVSGDALYASGGANAGFLYHNEEAPRNDMTIVLNNEKSGQVVPGYINDKMSLDVGDKLPTVKFEGLAKKCILSGLAQLTVAPVAATKLYLGSEYKQFKHDESAPAYIDVLANDGLTYKSKANKIVGQGIDMTGNYIEVLTAVTASINDYVAFHEPENHNPEFRPLNGMTGSIKVDATSFDEVRSIKFEYANNHQVFDNLALEDTISGFDPSKEVSVKFSCEVLKRKEHMPLINKLRESTATPVPVEITIGNTAGSKVVIFIRTVHIKTPNLSSKNDEVQTFMLEGEMVILPETVQNASVAINMC